MLRELLQGPDHLVGGRAALFVRCTRCKIVQLQEEAEAAHLRWNHLHEAHASRSECALWFFELKRLLDSELRSLYHDGSIQAVTRDRVHALEPIILVARASG